MQGLWAEICKQPNYFLQTKTKGSHATVATSGRIFLRVASFGREPLRERTHIDSFSASHALPEAWHLCDALLADAVLRRPPGMP